MGALGAQGGEVLCQARGHDLEDVRALLDVLERVVPEKTQGDVLETLGEESRGRRGDHDLSTPGSRADAGAQVDVCSHITLLGHGRLAGVDAHADLELDPL